MNSGAIRTHCFNLVPHFQKQIQQCGPLYALRKYLVITALFIQESHLHVSSAVTLPKTRSLLEHHPRTGFKYLHPYLANSFGLRTRATILAHHYNYINRLANANFIDRVYRGCISLWRYEKEGDGYAITLTCPRNEEGELMLEFRANGLPIFTLAFTFAPGKIFGLNDRQTMFIGRVQGSHRPDIIGHATKLLHELTPETLLLSSARAIASTLNIHNIVGVSVQNQICLNRKMHGRAKSLYDNFWTNMGGTKLNDDFYLIPTIKEEKPIEEIKANHRSRVKRKRLFKTSLQEVVRQTFACQCLMPHYLLQLDTRITERSKPDSSMHIVVLTN